MIDDGRGGGVGELVASSNRQLPTKLFLSFIISY